MTFLLLGPMRTVYNFKLLEEQEQKAMPIQRHALSIGALASATGVTAPTIRYYEDIGLLPAPDRSAGGRRTYGRVDVERLCFIRRARDFGFSIEEVRRLAGLSVSPGGDCSDVRDVASRHLVAVRSRLADLKALEATLTGFVGLCDASCAGGPTSDCAVFEVMAPA
jgi:MerR family transcriptional regulator, copper efflux regulator